MQVEEIFIWELETKESVTLDCANLATRGIFTSRPRSVTNQNAGFALVHYFGDTK